MVGDHLVRDVRLFVLVIGHAGECGDLFDDGLEQVGLKVAPYLLHNG